MTGWLLDTLVWTGALIALVLVLRRPVARHFGPRAAYALWLLPFARLILPPIKLPAFLAPEQPDTPVAFVLTGDVAALPAPPVPVAEPFDWAGLMLAVWLVGAVLFLARRFALYARMRRELLAEAVPVGQAGRVRLIETPLAPSPVAFGVIDKVVALPPAFMASADRTARDLALAHELAHHRGRDLIANFAVQPLFALHWFNPLGWLGWDAMRRDQEAACDARVVEGIARPEKAAYAALIAGLAAGPNIALAAPMACPVLGEKSIIQRLRSLTMNDISPRRRLLGRALVAGGLIALPLTASVSYATQDAQETPGEPARVEKETRKKVIIVDRSDGGTASNANVYTRTTADGDKTIIVKSSEPLADEEVDRRVADAEARMTSALAMDLTSDTGEGTPHRERRIIIRSNEGLSEEERARIRAEIQSEMKNMEGELAEARKEHRIAMIEMRRAVGDDMTRIDVDCKDGAGKGGWEQKGGKKVMILCKTDVTASALSGLREARDEIARDANLTGEIRAEVLKALDEQIARMSKSEE